MYVAREDELHSRIVASCTHPSTSGQGCYLCMHNGAIKHNLHLNCYSCRRFERDVQETMQDFKSRNTFSADRKGQNVWSAGSSEYKTYRTLILFCDPVTAKCQHDIVLKCCSIDVQNIISLWAHKKSHAGHMLDCMKQAVMLLTYHLLDWPNLWPCAFLDIIYSLKFLHCTNILYYILVKESCSKFYSTYAVYIQCLSNHCTRQ